MKDKTIDINKNSRESKMKEIKKMSEDFALERACGYSQEFAMIHDNHPRIYGMTYDYVLIHEDYFRELVERGVLILDREEKDGNTIHMKGHLQHGEIIRAVEIISEKEKPKNE